MTDPSNNQIVLAPAAYPNWATDATLVAIATILCLLGALAFNHCDLESE